MKITVNDLTLEEKLNLLTGKDMWHTYGANGKLKELFMCDGPCGVRTLYADGTEKASAFPARAIWAIRGMKNFCVGKAN